ncbi:MAG: GntR family transcriptional regulator [Desulfosarcinaceae bacterium]|nr:GntR family transcriptional regulator [Desulfosarcinaceae bacterium]
MTRTQTLRKQLLKLIQARSAAAGQQIPPELALCDRFRVSRHTMRAAIGELVQEGYLYRIQGKGTFIAHQKIHVPAQAKLSFRGIAEACGYAPGITFLSVYACHVEEQQRAAAALEHVVGELWCVEWVRSLDETPLVYSRAYLIKDRFPDLADHIRDDVDLYELLCCHYPVPAIVKEPYTLEVAPPRPDEMQALQIPISVPVFVVKSRSSDSQANRVDYRTSISRSDMIKFTNLTFEYDNRHV